MSLRLSLNGGTKRKAQASASSPEGSASKRARLPGPNDHVVETPERTTEEGLKFLDQLKKAQDKHGRPIATLFLTLPSRNDAPGYYQETLLPIAIDTVEGKLHRKEYPNLSAIESDVKRMVNNAKSYNDRSSAIFADAERIRKMLSNYMVKNNPAYKDPGYIAVPTPIPPHLLNNTQNSDGTTPTPKPSGKGTSTPATASPAPAGPSAGLIETEQLLENPDFTGKTFQQAQDQIMVELIKHQEDGLEIYTPFVALPSRSLADYYQVIKYPVSLNSVRKRIRGQQGRNQPTGITELKTWDAFENEMSYIWRNAREYNEDGSDISNLSFELEDHFKRRLADAKSKVSEPVQPMLKLKSSTSQPTPKPPGTKLRLGGAKASPAPPPDTPAANPRPSSTPGVSVDSEALRRQQELIQAGVNGQTSEKRPSSRNPFSSSRPGSAAPPMPPLSRSQQNSSAGSPPLSSSGVKAEASHGASASPAPQPLRSASGAPDGRGPSPLPNATMPPPSTAPRIPSGSPLPNGHTPAPYAPVTHASAPHPQPVSHGGATGGLSNRIRDAENPVSKALLPILSLSSQPSSGSLSSPPLGAKPYHLDIPAHPLRTQRSVTVVLPAPHATLRVLPRIADDVLRHRPYRTFVSLNGARMLGTPLKQKLAAEMVNGTGRAGGGDGGVEGGAASAEVREHEEKLQVFEARLQPGVNRIEVEVVVGRQRGLGGAEKGGSEIEGEKISVFVNSMRG
ncbi:MAG: hypothetical protein M1821_005112 [Bathelium mastoideum]|nr:MAG: hypothetical protein M1821_005112 [Bathelium mastoideum]